MTTPPANTSFVDEVMGAIRSTRAGAWEYGPMSKQHAMALVDEIERLRKQLAQTEKKLAQAERK